MLCPRCQVPLAMSERHGVEVDYCPQCRGVWLDRGELDKIIERGGTAWAPSQAQPMPEPVGSAPPPRFAQTGHYYGDRGHDQGHYRHKKKKTFLDDLFDF